MCLGLNQSMLYAYLSGKLEHRVRVQGNDELGELAMGIDRMRQSILRHRKSEDAMREANSELVTAMSHDLRTPLTSLLLYLEMLDRDKVSDEEQKKHLIHQSFSKAESIKDMNAIESLLNQCQRHLLQTFLSSVQTDAP